MTKEIKLTEDEIKSIDDIRNANTQLVLEYGQISIEKKRLDNRKKEADALYEELLDKESKLLNALREKYKNGSIDLDKKIFIPNDNNNDNKNNLRESISIFD